MFCISRARNNQSGESCIDRHLDTGVPFLVHKTRCGTFLSVLFITTPCINAVFPHHAADLCRVSITFFVLSVLLLISLRMLETRFVLTTIYAVDSYDPTIDL